MKHKTILFSFTFLCYLYFSSLSFAGVVSLTVLPGEDKLLFVDPPEGQSGVRVLNSSTYPFIVEIDGLTPPEEDIAPGYQLVDQTLGLTLVAKTEARRELGRIAGRARVRLNYDRRRIGRMGLRARELVLMRLKPRVSGGGAVWRPCSQLIRERVGRALKRTGPAVFLPGYYGVDLTNSYVWAVMDLPGQYAIGIPEPTAVMLLAAGTGLLAIRQRKQ